jgi:hypothetical protein
MHTAVSGAIVQEKRDMQRGQKAFASSDDIFCF